MTDTNYSIEDANQFVTDAYKARSNWEPIAKRSWQEVKKTSLNNKPLDLTRIDKASKGKYPLWNNTLKIRQPLLFSRIPEPIGLDTTMDGQDPIGATAAVQKERLARGLIKESNFFDAMSYSRDDFLITNIGQSRLYFKADYVKEKLKIRVQAQEDESGQQFFFDEAGNPVDPEVLSQDEEGLYIETDELTEVINERICIEPVLYADLLVEADCRRWEEIECIGFVTYYSERQFIKMFGRDAIETAPRNSGSDREKDKKKAFKIIELHNKAVGCVKWFIEGGSGFIEPIAYKEGKEEGEKVETNGLYDLSGFFPCTKPLIINQPTDDFFPVPEYYQVFELLNDIHMIFSRMMALTKAIRARLLFDNNIEGLKRALGEAAEGDAFGVTNLSQALAASGGTLKGAVQYVPVEEMINGLQQLYLALDQRLQSYYQLTGTADLLRGLTDGVERTFGEQQMKEKYALNQIAQYQYKMQEFARDVIELMCEMALKNFSDETLERYLSPRTMQPIDQQNYTAALQLLKDDRKGRFRVDLETDSMIAINQQHQIEIRKDLANTLSALAEKTATVAETNPSLGRLLLHTAKHLIQAYPDAKLFQTEFTQMIDQLIAQAEEASQQPPPPDPMIEIEQRKLALEEFKAQTQAQIDGQRLQIEQLEAQTNAQNSVTDQQIEARKLSIDEFKAQADAQAQAQKVQADAQQAFAELQKDYQKIATDLQLAQEDLSLEREKLLLELRKVTDKKGMDEFQAAMDLKIADFESKLAASELELKKTTELLSIQERIATEQRLQNENKLTMLSNTLDIAMKQKELEAPNKAEAPVAVAKSRRSRVLRDEKGDIAEIVHEEE